MKYMIMDIESIGLYGEAFAFGYVLLDSRNNEELGQMSWACNPRIAMGRRCDHDWVSNNVPELRINCSDPIDLRQRFWETWLSYRKDVLLFADCSYPVETNFIAKCVQDDLENRIKFAPYPLHDIASMLFAAGFDPLANYERLDNELPKHDPIKDARQSARLLTMAIQKLNITLPL